MREQGPISPKPLSAHILKVQKRLTVFFALSGSPHIKSALKMLVKSTPGVSFSANQGKVCNLSFEILVFTPSQDSRC